MIPKKGYSQLRKGRSSSRGQIYHIILKTNNRQPIFSNFYHARCFIKQLKIEEHDQHCNTYCFMVMPDHVHWLVAITKLELPKLVQRVKSLTTKRIGKRIWQSGFYDHGIRNDEKLVTVARYIVANPLRAGLVEKVGDYPHWDSIWMK